MTSPRSLNLAQVCILAGTITLLMSGCTAITSPELVSDSANADVVAMANGQTGGDGQCIDKNERRKDCPNYVPPDPWHPGGGGGNNLDCNPEDDASCVKNEDPTDCELGYDCKHTKGS